MAYGVKYRLEFSDNKGNGRKIEILKDGYTGSVLPMIGTENPVEIEYQSASEFYNYIIGSTCTLNLFVTDSVTYDDFWEFDNDEYQVKISYKDSLDVYQTYWVGFLNINQFKEAVTSTPYQISLKATDRLGTLDGLLAPKSNTVDSSNFDELHWYVYKILALTDLNLDMWVYNRIRKDGVLTSNDTILTDISVNEFAFMNPEITYRNAKELLESILKTLNMRLFQSNGKWFVISNTNVIDKNVTGSTGIQTAQTSRLTTYGTETIEYYVFNSSGVYQSKQSVDILQKVPTDLLPLGNNLAVEYTLPLRNVEFKVNLNQNKVVNFDPHFLSGGSDFTIASPSVGKVATVTFDTGEPVKSPVADRFFKTDDIDTTNTDVVQVTMPLANNTVEEYKKLEAGFTYYILNDGSDEKYIFTMVVRINDGTNNWYYDFKQSEWVQVGSVGEANKKRFSTNVTNSWGTAKVSMNEFVRTSGSGDLDIEVQFYKIQKEGGGSGNYVRHYIDVLYLSQSTDLEKEYMLQARKTGADGSSGTFVIENSLISNKLKNSAFVGAIAGEYERPRDTSPRPLEEIIVQEIINDFRAYGKRYTGTFYKNDSDPTPCFFHNKVWVDFGASVLREPVSCYIDSFKYSVKANEYSIEMHLPNQDDDKGMQLYEYYKRDVQTS
jgi:hypothetical protein